MAVACNLWGKGKTELELTNVKAMIIQCLRTFLGGDLQVVHGDPLRLACNQNFSC